MYRVEPRRKQWFEMWHSIDPSVEMWWMWWMWWMWHADKMQILKARKAAVSLCCSCPLENKWQTSRSHSQLESLYSVLSWFYVRCENSMKKNTDMNMASHYWKIQCLWLIYPPVKKSMVMISQDTSDTSNEKTRTVSGWCSSTSSSWCRTTQKAKATVKDQMLPTPGFW